MVLFPAALSFVSLFAGRSGVCFSAGFSFVCLSAGFFGAGLLFSVRFSACFSARRISAVRCRSPGRDADSRDFGDRTVEPLGRQHEEYRRFAPRPLLCDAEPLQNLLDRGRRLVECADQHGLRPARADAQCGVRKRVFETRPAVGVGGVVTVQSAQQGDLRADRVEGRLDERRGVEHRLIACDQPVEEFLAVGDAPQPRRGDYRVNRRPCAEFQQRFDAGGHARLHDTAHPPPQIHFGNQDLDVAAQLRARCYAIDVCLHFANISEEQFPPNPNELDSTEFTAADSVSATGRSPSSGIGSANPGLP